VFTLFVVPVFYSLIAAEHAPAREPASASATPAALSLELA